MIFCILTILVKIHNNCFWKYIELFFNIVNYMAFTMQKICLIQMKFKLAVMEERYDLEILFKNFLKLLKLGVKKLSELMFIHLLHCTIMLISYMIYKIVFSMSAIITICTSKRFFSSMYHNVSLYIILLSKPFHTIWT